MEVFFLHFSEGARMPGKLKTRNALLSEELWVGVVRSQVRGRIALLQLEAVTPIPVELFFSHLARRILSFGVYLVRNLQCRFIREEILSQTCFSQCWASTLSNSPLLSHELITFPAHAFHTQCEFLFLIRRKAPIVECVIRFRGS